MIATCGVTYKVTDAVLSVTSVTIVLAIRATNEYNTSVIVFCTKKCGNYSDDDASEKMINARRLEKYGVLAYFSKRLADKSIRTLFLQLSQKLPHHNAGRNGNIERMLGAKLRYLHSTGTGIHHILAHTFHFVAHH